MWTSDASAWLTSPRSRVGRPLKRSFKSWCTEHVYSVYTDYMNELMNTALLVAGWRSDTDGTR